MSNDKPIDPYRKGMTTYRALSDWKRPMMADTIRERFAPNYPNLDWKWLLNANEGISVGSVKLRTCIPNGGELGNCPECGTRLYVASVTIGSGDATHTVYWRQCGEQKSDPHHGFGKFSKHSNRAPFGRKAGSHNEPDPEPKVEPKQEPKPAPAPNPKPLPDEVVHPEILRAMKYVQNGVRNVYLSGPAGTGKSHGAANHIAKMMKAIDKWNTMQTWLGTTNQMKPVSDFEGFLDRLNGGKYVSVPLVEALQGPNLVILEEADKGNPNQAGFWNPILANFKVVTPGGTYDRHPDCVVIFIGNTTGHSPSKSYRGSVGQDFATLDRFRFFTVNYDETVERAAVPHAGTELYGLVTALRNRMEQAGSQRILGTRWLERAATTMRVEGIGAKKAIETMIADEHWSKEEKLAAGY